MDPDNKINSNNTNIIQIDPLQTNTPWTKADDEGWVGGGLDPGVNIPTRSTRQS